MFERRKDSTTIASADMPRRRWDSVTSEEAMEPFQAVRPFVGTTFYKPQIEAVFRRITEATQRLTQKAIDARRHETLKLCNAAIDMCACDQGVQTVADYYRQLEWSVLERIGNTDHLLSESTFRRHVNRRREERRMLAEAVARIERDFR